MNGDILMNWSQ